jgi:hypothetical protein
LPFAIVGAGHETAGAVASRTVTVKVHVAALFAASVAVHVTVVVPDGKVEPEAGVHETDGVPEQLSAAAGVANVTAFEHAFPGASTATLAGAVIVGAAASVTASVAVQVAALPAASVTVKVTVVLPSGALAPAAGDCEIVSPEAEQLSAAETFARRSGTAAAQPAPAWTVAPVALACGAVSSTTVTANEQVSPVSAVHVTAVVPTWNVEPDAGEHVTAPHWPVVDGAA